MNNPSDPSSLGSRLFKALITPTVTDWPIPRALPIAIAGSPSLRSSESPIVAKLIAFIVASSTSVRGTDITARSIPELVPLIKADLLVPLTNCTVRSSAPSTT